MPLISSESQTHQAEDMTYMTSVLSNIAQAKDMYRADDYVGALKILTKALKKVQELGAVRKDAGIKDYEILEAPLYYLQGHILTTYIETKSDVFGNIPQLEYDESSEEEEEEGDEEEDEGSQPA